MLAVLGAAEALTARAPALAGLLRQEIDRRLRPAPRRRRVEVRSPVIWTPPAPISERRVGAA